MEETRRKLLLLDHEMLHPEAHRLVLEIAHGKAWATTYRRYFPHFTCSDTTYDAVMVYGGRTPGVPGGQMSQHEVDRLVQYMRDGGMLVLGYYGSTRGMRGAHERYLFNQILARADVPIRINPDWVVDPENGYNSTLVPSSYLYPFPLIEACWGSPLTESIDSVFGGYQSSLAVGQGAAALLQSGPTAISVEGVTDFVQARTLDGPKVYKVAGAAKVGKGYVIVVSRFLMNMPGFTGRTSDKPLLNMERLSGNVQLIENLMSYIFGVVEGTTSWAGNTEYQPDELPDIETPDFEISREPVDTVPCHCTDSLVILEPKSDFCAWVDSNKLRIGYTNYIPTGDDRKCQTDLFHETGLNTCFSVNDAQYLYSPAKSNAEKQEIRDQWRQQAQLCYEDGIKCFLGSLYPHWEIFRNGDYHKLVDAVGKVYDAPSALDIRFWRDSVFRIAVEMAQMSLTQPGITGLFWDLEMYTFPGLNHQEGQAMEDASFFKFLNREKDYLPNRFVQEAQNLQLDQRYSWLRDNGLLRRYYGTLESEMRRVGEELRILIRDINPELQLAVYNLYIPNNWFYRGFLSGLSTKERPIVSLSYEACGKDQQSIAVLEGVYYYHCPGCLVNSLKPHEWEDALPRLAMEQDGYWLFPIGCLHSNRDPEKLTGDATINGDRAEVITGLARANRALDTRLYARNVLRSS